jgi:ATP-dependent 26S proteasome regulatory subunit
MNSHIDRHWSEVNSHYLLKNVTLLQQFLEQHWQHQQNPAEVDPTQKTPAIEIPDFSPPTALEQIYRSFNLSDFEIYLLLMGVGMAVFPQFSSLYANLHQNPQMTYPTFGLGLQLFPNAHWSAFTPDSPLRRWQLLQVGTGAVVTQCPLQIDESILHYLMGEPYQDDRLSHLIQPLPKHDTESLSYSHQKIVQDLIALVNDRDALMDSSLVQLCGWDNAEKRAIACAASTQMNRPIKVLLADRLPTDQDNITYIIHRWQREFALTQSILLLDCDGVNLSDPVKLGVILQFIGDLNTPLIISTEERIYNPRTPLISFDVPPLTYEEQLDLWQTNLGDAAEDMNGHVEAIVAQFNLSPKAIKTACHHLHNSSEHSLTQPEENVTDSNHELELDTVDSNPSLATHLHSQKSQKLWNICRTMARPRLDDMAQRIDTKATWDDLVLPEQPLKTLKEIAAQFRQRAKVYQQWGFASKNNRGLGMTSLFAGPSGTGKTMASEVLAQEFNLDLYRIDLSTVVSKYIGETEKNLRRIFDAAESGGAVLLFDEADALFGKRTEVKDSHDRHANVEVSYLLQRMEAYQGLAILTTNLKGSLDQAFLRRIRFIISFPFPDVKAREEIWSKIFPPATPTKGLMPKKLAKFSVAGGNIKNIALNAAFIAADAGEPVMMKHILAASRSEAIKIEKPLLDSEIKGWV